MRQRWDAEQQRWIDEDAGAVGAQPPTGQAGQPGQAHPHGQVGPPPHGEERPWWAGAETQIGTVRPPSVPETPPPSATPTYAAPPPPSPAAPSYPRQPAYVPATFPGAASVPAPGPHPRRPRTTLVLVAVLAVLVGSGAAAGVWWLTRDDPARQAQARPSVTATTGHGRTAPPAGTGGVPPSPSDTERALASSAGPSPGYRRAEDPVGYRVDVPEGWVREEERGVSAEVVTYRSPSDGRSLLIFEVVEESPAASLDLAENGPGGFVEKLAGYRVLDRSSGPDWAELDYRYDDTSSGATQVVDRRFTAADGTLYAIRSSGPEGSDVREPFDAAFASFCPTGASCPAT